MKKLTKILLPIASTVAVAAPVASLVSCSFMANVQVPEKTIGNSFVIRAKFKEVVQNTDEFTFSVNNVNIELAEARWAGTDEFSTASIRATLNMDDLKDGDVIKFTFKIVRTWTDEDGASRTSNETHPLKITYASE